MMYQIIQQLVDIPAKVYLTPLTGRTQGHDSRFRQIQTSYTGYKYSFFPRTIILWNQIPQSAISQSMLEAFQRQLAVSTNSTPHNVFNLLPLLTVAYGLFPTHCENTQLLREAITEDEDGDDDFCSLPDSIFAALLKISFIIEG